MSTQDEDLLLPHFSLGQKAGMFTLTAMMACGGDALLHAPPPLALGGIVGAYVLARKSPQLYQGMRKAFPLLPDRTKPAQAVAMANGEWSILDRFLGRHLQPGFTPPHVKESEREDGTVVDVSEQEDEEYTWDGDEEIIPMTTPGHSGGLFTFSQVLDTGFIPTLKKIYVGSTEEGTPLFVEAKDLCHVALGGNTGGGKTSLIRMLMAQLCKAGATVYLLNPHYTVYDREHDEDWTPFTPYLKEDPMMCSEYDKIEYYLEQLAGPVLRKRIDLVKSGQLPGKPCFVIIDELPAIVKECAKNVPGFMEKLLREGRKYGIFLIVGSQDFLVKTIGTDGGAVRQCFRTGYYVGGDPTTARNLLEQGIAIPETRLGKGIAMLRCAATKKTIIAKIPYVDNASLYRLLGPSTFFQAPPSRTPAQPVQVLPDLSILFDVDEEVEGVSFEELCDAVAEMAMAGESDSRIMRHLDLSRENYITIAKYIQSHLGEFRSVSPEAPKTPQRPNLSVVPPVADTPRSFPQALPQTPVNAPTERVEFDSDEGFIAREDDLLLSELQIQLLKVFYQSCSNVNKSLEQIRDEKGRGLGGRYTRHASFILEQAGLKKVKRA